MSHKVDLCYAAFGEIWLIEDSHSPVVMIEVA